MPLLVFGVVSSAISSDKNHDRKIDGEPTPPCHWEEGAAYVGTTGLFAPSSTVLLNIRVGKNIFGLMVSPRVEFGGFR